MPRYRELAATMAQHQKRKQSIKAHGRNHTEVNGDRLRLGGLLERRSYLGRLSGV
jgi:hypothetical protein